MNRPQTTLILAMSADGKIADVARSPARFSSTRDKAHLEEQIARADAVLFGAATLRAYGTTLPIANSQLLERRQREGKALQPAHIVCSASGNLNPQYPFFSQPVPRWLLTTAAGAKLWQDRWSDRFDRLFVAPFASASPEDDGIAPPPSFNWTAVLMQLKQLGISQLAILGGGQLAAALFAEDLIDELWLTVCPLLLGGATAPTPVEGLGFSAEQAKPLELLSVRAIAGEVFLHYQCRRENQN